MEPEKSRLSFWASAWVLGVLSLLSAALWPQAWAQVAMVEPGDSQPQPGWWSERAGWRGHLQLNRAIRELQTEAWARERARFLADLAEDDSVLKGLEPQAFGPASLQPSQLPNLAQSLVQWMMGRRMPAEFEVRYMEEAARSGISPYVDMRLNGVNMAIGIPLSSQVSLQGGVLADFVVMPPVFSEGLGLSEIFRSFTNLGYSMGFDFRNGDGSYLFGRVIMRGNEFNFPGQASMENSEPLFLGLMVGTQFDRNWTPVVTRTSEAR